MKKHLKIARFGAAIIGAFAFGPIGLIALALCLIGPALSGMGTAYPAISGATKTSITTASPDGAEIAFDLDVIKGATETNIMYDNMIGQLGSGKAFIDYSGSLPLAGTTVQINTVAPLGGSGVAAGGVRVGAEEAIRPGNFPLTIGQWWFGVGITNTGRAETIIGSKWEEISQPMLSPLIGKKCSHDMIMTLRKAATSDNTVIINSKTVDTLLPSDTYSTGILIATGNAASRIGAVPMTIDMVTRKGISVPNKGYLNLVTKQGSNPIKLDPAYRNALLYAQERGDKNPFFTGEIKNIDGQLVVPWENPVDASYGPKGSPLQPEAFLGTAIPARTTLNTIAAIDGGGVAGPQTSSGATYNYFENFSLFNYLLMSQSTIVMGTGTRYFSIIDAQTGKVSFFSYTANTGGYTAANQLTGIKRLGSTNAGDYQTTIGGVTWDAVSAVGAGSFTVAGDGNGYNGVSEDVISVGSLIVECNALGTPIAEGLTLGEMAGVCGWGTTAISKKKFGGRTTYVAPHNQAFAEGFEIAWGCAAFKRADSQLPNYIRQVFARSVPGMPTV